MNKEIFKEELKKLNINITKKEEEQLNIYYEFLKEYNSHTNLTAIIDEEDVYLKHFYDSLTITKAIDLNEVNTLLDIGTGAGFPGMVLKIFYPHLEVTLLDSNNKKIKFLEELSIKLGVNNVFTIKERSEIYINEKREYFDIVTSRAVASLNLLSELSLPYVKKDGYFIPLKGDSEKELEESMNAINKLGGEVDNIVKFLLPNENSSRSILLIKKIKSTPLVYPRVYDKILKKPL